MRTGSKILIIYAVSLALILLAIMAQQPVILSQARESLFDSYQRIKPRTYDAQVPIRVVDIDEASLNDLGQWPWPRTYLAELTQRLYALDAATIGFDILFVEPDRTSPRQIQKAWDRFSDVTIQIDDTVARDHDALFAQSLRLGPSVLVFSGGGNQTKVPLKAGISYTGESPQKALTQYETVTNPLPALAEAAAGIGSISLGHRQTSIVRTNPALVVVNEQIAPSFALELLRVAQGAGSYVARTTQASGEIASDTNQVVNIRVGSITIPLTSDGQVRPYFSGYQKERTLSARHILAGTQVDEGLRDKIAGHIVLVGSSATGLFDVVTTPLAQQVAGVNIHAEILEQSIANQFLHRPDWVIGAEAIAVLAAILIVLAILIIQRPILSLMSVVLVIYITIGISFAGFSQLLVLIDPLPVILAVLLTYLPSTATGFWLKERARAAMNYQFEHFLPAPLIKKITNDPQTMLTPGGAERELTIIFLDVRQFSTLTQHMSANEVVDFVNDFLTPLSALIVQHHGVIDKFIGDAIMGFWNAPVPLKDHPQYAARMILEAQNTIKAINSSNANKNLPAINVGIGANTGLCAVGMMGSKNRLGYTCIGDTVNLTSRLEGLTKLYGVHNCVGENFVSHMDDTIIAMELDLVAVKGRDTPERIFTLMGDRFAPNAQALMQFTTLFHQMRTLYMKQAWQNALKVLDRLEKQGTVYLPNKLLHLYRRRIAYLQKHPPAQDWQGVYVAQGK